jgi:archaellum component FlaC
MQIDGETISAWGLVLALIGVVWKMLNSRIKTGEGRMDKIEDLVTRTKENFNGKAPLIFASEQRLDDLEKRLDRLEDKFVLWLQRIEEKIDALRDR